MTLAAPLILIPGEEIELSAIRSQGAGGQNVNKTSTAVHLRFDILASSLSEPIKQRLLQLRDQRITRAGVVVIKAQQHRSQEQNRDEAVERLHALVQSVAVLPRQRRATRPTRASKLRRIDSKVLHGRLKASRAGPRETD